MPALLLTLALVACGQVSPSPTLPPPPETVAPSPSPGPETPTPRPEALTQPVPEATPVAGTEEPPEVAATADGTPLPQLQGDVFAEVAAIGADVPGTVVELRFTPEGTLWLLTDQAVARLAGDAWEVYLPEYDGELVGIDDLHRVWVAAADGTSIDAWDGSEWQTYGAGEGWTPVEPGADGPVARTGLTADQAGRVWLATAADVRAFDGEQWEVYDRAALGLAESAAGDGSQQFHVAVARTDGAVWVSACGLAASGPTGGGVRWFDGEAWQGADSPVDSGCGGAITSSAQGPVWVGLDDTVIEYDPFAGEWTPFEAPAPPAGETFGYVADLALDPSERPWPLMAVCGSAGCEGGRVRYRLAEDGTWTQIGPVTDAEQTLLFDTAGSGWLLSEAGALRASGDQVQAAGDVRVLASARDNVGQIYVAGERDGQTALWLISPAAE